MRRLLNSGPGLIKSAWHRCPVRLAKAASISLLMLADRTSMFPPIDDTAARQSVIIDSVTTGLLGFAKTASRVASGMKISTLAAVCDGERIRKAEPQGDRE